MRRDNPNIDVKTELVCTLPTVTGGLPDAAMFWFESNIMTVSPNVASVKDQSPNGVDLTFATQATYQAVGGPTGGPAWVADQEGLMSGADITKTPCQNPQTIYSIYYANSIAGIRKLINTDNINNYIGISDAVTGHKMYIYDSAQRARIFGPPTGVWIAVRHRWNATIEGIKYNGVAETTEALGAPLMTAGSFWRAASDLANITQNPTVLIAGFDEDTLASGLDADISSYIFDTYGLTI